MSRENGKYPSTIYRTSVKAIIRNSKGEVLLTKESGEWFFPGGGVEHGESILDALKRELYEEAKIDAPFEAKPIGIETVFIDPHDTWLMWLFYEVILPEGFSYGIGDVQDVAFKNPHDFRNKLDTWERYVYKWAK